jgi:cytochrome b561
MLQNNVRRYGAVAMTLHWLIALSIFANVILAFYFNDLLSHRDPARGGLVTIHESIGLTVLVLSLLRLGWRLVNVVPPLPGDMSAGLKRLAHATHYALYTLMILVPALGWGLASTARSGKPASFFYLFDWPNLGFLYNLPKDDKRFYGHWIGTVHEWLGYVLLFLALAHVAAALYHHYARRDQVLARMMPGSSPVT